MSLVNFLFPHLVKAFDTLKVDNSVRTMNSLDVECSICLEVLIKPVTLPCQHEFCLHCFEQHVSQSISGSSCPICRSRIISWARQAKAEGKLINEDRWEFIQKRFPKRVHRRLNNLDSDSDDEETSALNSTVDLTVDDVEEAITTVPTTSAEHKTTEKRSKRKIICVAGEGTRRRSINRASDGPMTKEQQEANDYRYALRLHKKLNKSVVASEQSAAGPRSPYLLRRRMTHK